MDPVDRDRIARFLADCLGGEEAPDTEALDAGAPDTEDEAPEERASGRAASQLSQLGLSAHELYKLNTLETDLQITPWCRVSLADAIRLNGTVLGTCEGVHLAVQQSLWQRVTANATDWPQAPASPGDLFVEESEIQFILPAWARKEGDPKVPVPADRREGRGRLVLSPAGCFWRTGHFTGRGVFGGAEIVRRQYEMEPEAFLRILRCWAREAVS